MLALPVMHCAWILLDRIEPKAKVAQKSLREFQICQRFRQMTTKTLINGHLKRYYEFGAYRLDPAKRRLLRAGEVLPLPPKAFDLLLVLVEHQGQVIDKEDLLQAVWPDTVVEEANLSVSISVLRKTLGEAPNERQYIETLPRRGYRFIPSVTPVSGAPP